MISPTGFVHITARNGFQPLASFAFISAAMSAVCRFLSDCGFTGGTDTRLRCRFWRKFGAHFLAEMPQLFVLKEVAAFW